MDTEATPAQADVSELDLVKQCQEGNLEAFDQLVSRYRNRVFGMIYNMVHNEQDAWDLAQDSFLKAWKSIGRFRGQSSFYTWIYRIVTNVTIDWLRKKQVKGFGGEFDDSIQLKEIDPASRTAPQAAALPHKRMERHEIRARIDEAIEQLRKTVEMDPTFDLTHWFLGQAYENNGQLAEAIAQYEKAVQLNPDPAVLASLARAYALAGRKEETRKILDDLTTKSGQRYIPAYSLALIHLSLGDKEEALRFLEKSYEERAVFDTGVFGSIKIDRRLEPLRGDPRFENLVERVFSEKKE